MKRVLIILLATVISIDTWAIKQDDNNDTKTVWCTMTWYLGSKSKHTIYIRYAWGDEQPKDSSGNDLLFDNEIAAIAYMTLQGWQLAGTPLNPDKGNIAYMYSFYKNLSDSEAAILLNKLINKKNQ